MKLKQLNTIMEDTAIQMAHEQHELVRKIVAAHIALEDSEKRDMQQSKTIMTIQWKLHAMTMKMKWGKTWEVTVGKTLSHLSGKPLMKKGVYTRECC